jgi:hypothetical protein
MRPEAPFSMCRMRFGRSRTNHGHCSSSRPTENRALPPARVHTAYNTPARLYRRPGWCRTPSGKFAGPVPWPNAPIGQNRHSRVFYGTRRPSGHFPSGNPSACEKEDREECRPLSEKRAAAIKQALVRFGVRKARIKAVGKGAGFPIVPHHESEDVRWGNRRAGFYLKKPK